MGYRLLTECGGMLPATFVSLRGSTATFRVVDCPGCGHEHTLKRRAGAGCMRTNTSAEPRVRYQVVRGNTPTGYALWLPYSMIDHGKKWLELGTYRCRLLHQAQAIVGDDMPDSWFIDLSLDVEESKDGTDLSLEERHGGVGEC
jgi:hypothetical protein